MERLYRLPFVFRLKIGESHGTDRVYAVLNPYDGAPLSPAEEKDFVRVRGIMLGFNGAHGHYVSFGRHTYHHSDE